MKKCLFLIIVLIAGCATAMSQTQECPSGMVCISPEAARKALQDSDTVEAQKVELKAKDQAIEDLRKELNAMRVEFARVSGEKSQLEQDRVRWTAIIDILIKNSRKKSIGFIAF